MTMAHLTPQQCHGKPSTPKTQKTKKDTVKSNQRVINKQRVN